MSQQELADTIGAGRRAVNNWENDHAVPQGKFAARLEKALPDTPGSSDVVDEPRSGANKTITRRDRSADEDDDRDVRLVDADFAQTLNHLADLYREAARTGSYLREEVTPFSSDFLVHHDVIAGPPLDPADDEDLSSGSTDVQAPQQDADVAGEPAGQDKRHQDESRRSRK